MTNASRRPVYTGVTNDLLRRVWEHRFSGQEGYTKQYKLFRLVWFEKFVQTGAAIEREKEIKGWTRAKKYALVETMNPKWDDLSRGWFPAYEKTKVLRSPNPR